jgi:CelD/BcsL family acetyltransferase involved in cellulose biosynthesis
LRIVLHRKIPEDSSLLRGWNDLVLQMERPEVFYTCEWALAVQSAYQASLKPLLFLGYDGYDLVGVACLGTDVAEEKVSFLAANTGDYCEFLSHPQRRAEFVDAIFREISRTKVGSLALANLPEDSTTPAALRAAAKKQGFHIYTRPAYLCAQIDLGAGEARQALKNSLLNKKKLRRYLRELEREGQVTFAHLQSWDRIRTALPGFADAHLARFHATHRVSSLETPERRRFLDDLAQRFSGAGVVTLSLMMVGDRPVAWNYGFQFCGSWFWYQPTFDSRYEENSPGHCLLSRIVIEACDLSTMRVVDLGLGAEGYKERFANSTRQTLYAMLTKSSLNHVREIARFRLASAVNRSPRLEAAIRRALATLGR